MYKKVLFSKKYPHIKKLLSIFKSKDFSQEVLKPKNKKTFFEIFLNSDIPILKTYFNFHIKRDILNSLMKDNANFAKMLNIVVSNNELKNLQKSLLSIFLNNNLSAQSNFLLGINSLKYKKNKLAQYYLSLSYEMSRSAEHKNKSLFWLYLTTNDEQYLQKLAKSNHIDFYSILALDRLGIKLDVISDIRAKKENKKSLFNVKNPFAYERYKKKHKDKKYIDYGLLHEDTIAHLIYQYNRFFDFKKSFFYMPDYIKYINEDINQKAFLMAIARQESMFIPTSISKSFAAGVMQILPMVSEEIAQRAGYKYDEKKMFDPKVSVKYANYHIKKLRKYLKNPLFLAYAYSNGLSFTLKILKRGYFNISKKYEPYLSMELMPNKQANKYGKRVLGNYIIYKRLLGEDVDIMFLLKNIRI